MPTLTPVEITPIELGGFAQFNRGRMWGQIHAGIERSRILDEGRRRTSWAPSLGASGGADVVTIRGNRLGVAVDVAVEPLAESSYVAIGFGLTYRR
jgi:hypothetical protein